jgi:hypothetical protein
MAAITAIATTNSANGSASPRAASTPAGPDGRGDRPARPDLRVVPARPTGRVLAARRLVAVAVLLGVVLLLTGLVGRVTAAAGPTELVAGQVVAGPGETLWDIAVATAPAGVDAREHLAAIVRLNGFDGGALAPWTVVLLPAR